ncbi:MAG: hypothetical protein AAB518_01645, partial [Patescibacteria group bacterium]
ERHVPTMQRMICGDMHDNRKGDMRKRIANAIPMGIIPSRARRVLLACERKLVVCPSTAPLWWRGYGLLTVKTNPWITLTDPHLLSIPENRRVAPTASALTCLWWCVKPKP